MSVIRCRRSSRLDAPQEVPVTRLGHDLIRSEDAHPVDFWVGVIFGGQVTADDLVFLKTHLNKMKRISVIQTFDLQSTEICVSPLRILENQSCIQGRTAYCQHK